jgi:hypothetical protein
MEIKPSHEDLLKVVYQYYPRAPMGPDHIFEGFGETEEHRRLVAARIRAGTENGKWRAMLDRLRARFPECEVEDRAYYLATGGYDAAYAAKLVLPTLPPNVGQHAVGFLVSFLVPYYVIYRLRWRYLPEAAPTQNEEASKEAQEGPLRPRSTTEEELNFELTEEQTYKRGIAEEIEATFGFAPMPPALGRVIVPDAWISQYDCGTATIFDCLFTDHW